MRRHKLGKRGCRYCDWVIGNRPYIIAKALRAKDPESVVQSFAREARIEGFSGTSAERDCRVIVNWAIAYKKTNPGRTPKELFEGLPKAYLT